MHKHVSSKVGKRDQQFPPACAWLPYLQDTSSGHSLADFPGCFVVRGAEFASVIRGPRCEVRGVQARSASSSRTERAFIVWVACGAKFSEYNSVMHL